MTLPDKFRSSLFDKCLLFPCMYESLSVSTELASGWRIGADCMQKSAPSQTKSAHAYAGRWLIKLIIWYIYVYKKIEPVCDRNYGNLQCYLTLLMSWCLPH